ncbi:MAG: PEP-CTERM sorting domain-containing protein [Sedimentisphaerales bacterium]|nr:PEP-CTERM sorting domain-containing protein [Sedimentisphaerales bacterium]
MDAKKIWGKARRGYKIQAIIVVVLAVIVYVYPVTASTITFTEGHHTWTSEDPYYDAIILDNDASLDYEGGFVGMLDAYNLSIANITGGIITHLRTSDESIVHLHESTNMDIMEAKGTSVINLHTNDYILSTENGHYDYGYIEGTYYETTTYFYIHFYNSTTYSNLNIVPEPATFLIFTVGSIFLRRRK